jgi:hypothetical protein
MMQSYKIIWNSQNLLLSSPQEIKLLWNQENIELNQMIVGYQ